MDFSSSIIRTQIPTHLAGLRLDQALSELFPQFSRSRLQNWIKKGSVLINGTSSAPKHRIIGGEYIILHPVLELNDTVKSQDIPLDIVYEDEAVIVVNKPAGLVVHPAPGHTDNTLQNALLHYCPDNAGIPRCGLVHRLDKDTSGLLVAAKTLFSHNSLIHQLQARTVHREYLALVQGTPTGGGTIDAPIGRHPMDRKRFSVREGGKPAVTHYRLIERFSHHTLLKIKLETGRTHQIRVHLSHIRYPILGDPVYGGRSRPPPGSNETLRCVIQHITRQALHAATLGFIHPDTNEYREWHVSLPDDFTYWLDSLRSFNRVTTYE